MSTTKKIITQNFNIENSKDFSDSITGQKDTYYVFVGRHIPYEPDDSAVITPDDSMQSSVIDVYNNMIFGKKISSQDVAHMINRQEWVEGTVYNMYDHESADLVSNACHVYTQSGSYYNVYKCLNNNNESPSTVEPNGLDVAPFYTPNDGYTWKYMFSIPEATFNKFKTSNYIPIVANNSVEANAVPGAIEHINVDSSGRGYNNYISNGEFKAIDIQISGSDVSYGLVDSASSLNGYYEGCILKVTSGAAENEYREIVGYTVAGGQKIATLASAFTNSPGPTDTYEVFPNVYVYGDGNETNTCVARAIVSSNTANSISRIEILDTGAGYRAANAVLRVSNVVDVQQEAILRPIISPIGGHGSDPIKELGGNKIGLSVKFSNTENGYIPADNDFRTVGVIKNPEFQNVSISLNIANTQGTFVVGEALNQYRDILLKGTITTNGSNIIVGSGTYFDDALVSGDIIHISDGLSNMFTYVNSISNSTYLTVSSNVSWNSSSATVALVNSNPYGVVASVSTGEVTVSNLNSKYITNKTKLYGSESYAVSQVNAIAILPISIGGVEVNGLYDSFIEMSKFIGSVTSSNSNIIADEYIRQEIGDAYSQPTGRFHSYANSASANVIYATNIKNTFNSNAEIINESNTVTFDLSTKYNGDLVKDSGEILYIENIDAAISRANNKSETIKLILEF